MMPAVSFANLLVVALVGAGLVSVVVFPVLALTLLRYSRHDVTATPALQSAQTAHGVGGDG